MNSAEDILLKLIRVSVAKVPVGIPSDIDWTAVMNLASDQGVLGIAFDALAYLPAEFRPDTDTFMDWYGQVIYMETQYEAHFKAIKNLCSFYDGQGIKMMLLKGYGLSLNWPEPNHRPTGDIDAYTFHLHDSADQMVHEKLGIEIDNSHHKHSVFSYEGETIENHHSFLNTYGHKSSAEIELILHDIIDEVKDPEIANLYYSSVKFNSLYLLRHLGEHFASVDINLRQVLDWGFFVQKNEVDWDWLLTTLDKVGMKKFLALLNAVCYTYLGFNQSLFPDLAVNEALLERCMNDILHPEVESERHRNTIAELWFRFRRWWKNGWKQDLVFKEIRMQSLMTQMWSHILKPSL